MKKLILALGGTLAVAIPLMADTEKIGNYTWTYSIEDEKVEICNGSFIAVSPEPSGVLAIPAMLGGYPVVSIGANSFRGCSSLTGATIPGTVTNIGAYAFRGCSSITGVTMPDGVASIGNDAFADCSSIAN